MTHAAWGTAVEFTRQRKTEKLRWRQQNATKLMFVASFNVPTPTAPTFHLQITESPPLSPSDTVHAPPHSHLAMYPSFGGWNFLNLWTFRDDSNPEAIEMSAWVRWYAGMLEQNLTVSRMLGYHLNSTPRSNNRNKILDSELLKEIDVLINFADHLSTVPNSLYLKRESLVYESLRLVSEDYRLVQREIFVRVVELGARTTILSSSECTEFLSAINRLGCCKERVSLLLVNRNRNEDLWDLIKGTKENLVATMKKEEEQGKMVAISVGNESRMLNGFSELYRLASRGRWVEF
ncbi:putative 2-oxoglutarate/Fe(II)-dependent dioxygenase-like isoform X1 [Hibiscus syriacus]|uniref:2-oxoglutarate/Fe(II)-dependent dioxygenase-like isoform X1 n=1 Tax=Hibiscus syriacus TaxID=106335 RepID=A0A6A3BRR0_HIBSY|nr:putative 2-oxoglutarate/Fe(II)-dependent dioxygenase-like isoform X1 [Hibiscus syriacus]